MMESVTDDSYLSPIGDDRCQFPAGPDGEICGEPIARSGAPGRPSLYCDNPDHTRARAFAARRSLERGRPGAVVALDVAVPERPVTDGRTSLGALLVRFEESAASARRAAADQHAQFVGILDRATEVVRTVSDPDAAGYEVEQIQREASVRVAEAETARAAAERDARDARRKADTEAELRAQADEAADVAVGELAAVRVEAAETIARFTAETERAIAEHAVRAQEAAAVADAARAEADKVRADAAEEIAAAEQSRRDTVAETERLLAERDAEMRRRINEASAQAAERVDAAVAEAAADVEAARRRASEAETSAIRAQADQAAAERRAEEERSAAADLRGQLERQRGDHHLELSELRGEIREEREQMREERSAYAHQLAALLAALQPTAVGEPGVAPVAPVSGRPGSQATPAKRTSSARKGTT